MALRCYFNLPLALAVSLTVGFPAWVGASGPGDWPMWGGRPDRNMASDQRGLPTTWNVREKHNLKWSVNLGSQTYGNPIVAGGKIYIGTNNSPPRDPAFTGDKGVLLCLAENDGRFLWQAVHDKLEPMDVHDWPDIGLCSAPCVVDDRLYYVSNRGELVCADTEGFLDGENDGPFKDEPHHGPADADFVWVLDMVRELGVWPHWGSASSPMVVGDLLFVVTGNGADPSEDKVPAPKAPSFIAVNRQTGKVVWSDNSPGDRLVDGQWSAPCYGVVNGQPQVIFPGGDGWLYAFQPADGKPLWKFDCNKHLPPDEATDRKTRNFAIATPVFHQDRVYIAPGTTPETSEGPGCLYAIDATKTGDLTAAPAWEYHEDEFAHSVATVAIADGLIYAVEARGFIHCLEADTGKHLWKYDLNAATWASPLVADGKVYIGTEDGDVHVLAHSRELKSLGKNRMKEQIYATATPANGVLYIADRTHLYALADSAAAPATRPTASAPATQTSAGKQAPRPSAQSASTPGDWPMFRGNPQLTGVATAEPPAKPELRWKYRATDAIESSAAVAAGAVYVGCNDNYLYCLDLANGGFNWKFKAEGPIKSSPLVHAGMVYFGDSDGIFHAVDAASGKQKWFYKTDDEIISSANHIGERILFGSYDSHLYCLNAADGKLMWKFESEGRVHGTPGIIGDKVLVAGCDEDLHVVNLADGTQAATVSMGSFSGASAAIADGRVFVGTFGDQVLAIDWAAKRIAWTFEHAEPKSPFYASAAVRGDVVVIAEQERLVHALDAKSGDKRWTFDTKGRVDGSPVIAGQRVFIGSTEGVFYALNLADGQPTWQFDTGAGIVASAAVGETIVIGTDDGTVYCLGAPLKQS